MSKIKTFVGSSKLLFQQNFDKASNAGPFSARYKAVVALGFLLLCGTTMAAAIFIHPDYSISRSLLDHGVSAVGVVENVDEKTEPRGKGGRNYITTINYRS